MSRGAQSLDPWTKPELFDQPRRLGKEALPWTKENVVEVNSKMESALWKMLEEF